MPFNLLVFFFLDVGKEPHLINALVVLFAGELCQVSSSQDTAGWYKDLFFKFAKKNLFKLPGGVTRQKKKSNTSGHSRPDISSS